MAKKQFFFPPPSCSIYVSMYYVRLLPKASAFFVVLHEEVPLGASLS